ncbi:MAG: hypothetical protein IJ963_05655 [Phascolarctobacterium sp.]|nr:hypothetical protein [Phascolarctobacterium sp.]MBR6636880.1 hypothetical protein [Phascolarctobacterium sp.]
MAKVLKTGEIKPFVRNWLENHPEISDWYDIEEIINPLVQDCKKAAQRIDGDGNVVCYQYEIEEYLDRLNW